MKRVLKERCEEAIRQEVLKDFKGKLVSKSGYRSCIVNETSGRYRVIDADVSIEEHDYWGENICFEYQKIYINILTETLKGKKKKYFDYDLI